MIKVGSSIVELKHSLFCNEYDVVIRQSNKNAHITMSFSIDVKKTSETIFIPNLEEVFWVVRKFYKTKQTVYSFSLYQSRFSSLFEDSGKIKEILDKVMSYCPESYSDFSDFSISIKLEYNDALTDLGIEHNLLSLKKFSGKLIEINELRSKNN